MPFNVKKRGKLTYYYTGDRPVLSALVTEELPDGDLKISFAGLTGGYSAKGVLGLDELVTMEPKEEIPLVFKSWELWLQDAGICDSLRDVDFIEIHAFGCQQAHFFIKPGQAWRHPVTAKKLARLRFENDDDAWQSQRGRLRLDLRQHLAMPQMHAIEVADCCHATTVAVTQIV